ncbi:MAG: helix-turn-helix domain-containing protein [Vulcanimicrobiota bacterium]
MWTPEKASKLLNITVRTVKNYLCNGTIKGVKVARKWLIPDSDLQACVDGLKAKRDTCGWVKVMLLVRSSNNHQGGKNNAKDSEKSYRTQAP